MQRALVRRTAAAGAAREQRKIVGAIWSGTLDFDVLGGEAARFVEAVYGRVSVLDASSRSR